MRSIDLCILFFIRAHFRVFYLFVDAKVYKAISVTVQKSIRRSYFQVIQRWVWHQWIRVRVL